MYFDCMPASVKAKQREERNMFLHQLQLAFYKNPLKIEKLLFEY